MSGRTKNNYLTAISTVFSYAQMKSYLPRERKSEAEFATRYDDSGGDIGIYTPAQLDTLLRHIEKRVIPFLAFGAFAGLRSAEIVRLEWEDVLWDQGFIEIKARKAKTASRRLIPILPALTAWLVTWRNAKGQVLTKIRDEFALAKQFKRAVDRITGEDKLPLVKIVHNGLRHSFITYRMALEKNAASVALEAGNSPKMIFEHYRELATPTTAKNWFAVMP